MVSGPDSRKKRVSFGDPDEDPNAALPGSPTTGEWFGMDSINPRQSSDPAGAFGVGPEREQGFGFSASILDSGLILTNFHQF